MEFRCEFRRINAITGIVINWLKAWPLFPPNRIRSNFQISFLSIRNVSAIRILHLHQPLQKFNIIRGLIKYILAVTNIEKKLLQLFAKQHQE